MISFREKVSSIIGGQMRWWDCPQKTADMAALHGCVIGEYPLNDHGVFINCEDIEISGDKESNFSNATIHLASTPRGHWLMSYGYQIHWHGQGSLPGISRDSGFESRAEALETALNSLVKACDNHLSGKQHDEHYKTHALKLRNALEIELGKQKQLTLF